MHFLVIFVDFKIIPQLLQPDVGMVDEMMMLDTNIGILQGFIWPNLITCCDGQKKKPIIGARIEVDTDWSEDTNTNTEDTEDTEDTEHTDTDDTDQSEEEANNWSNQGQSRDTGPSIDFCRAQIFKTLHLRSLTFSSLKRKEQNILISDCWRNNLQKLEDVLVEQILTGA